ncbi:MAG: DUF998 domain-containing protein [Bacteroidetes bacterium]|nr:DUF998 domain-containing protein [Bacteroidota bacterium]
MVAYFKLHYPLISVSIFLSFIIVAHIFSSPEYSFVKNTINDLGAQGYSKKLIMQTGFLLFGITLSSGILLNGMSLKNALILIYGLCVALTGIFCTKPFLYLETTHYSKLHSNLHSAFAQIAGIAFSIGILLQWYLEKIPDVKWKHLLFFTLIISCSLAFGLIKNYQGVVQRLLYLISFWWLARYYAVN